MPGERQIVRVLCDPLEEAVSAQFGVELCGVDGPVIEAERFIINAGARRQKRGSFGEFGYDVLMADLDLEAVAKGAEDRVVLAFGRQLQPIRPDLGPVPVRDHLTAHGSGHGLKSPARSERRLGRFV